jgi:hypothetical protein
MRLETVREQDAYDEGFANGKDYWMPLEQDRILQIVQPWFAQQLEEGKLTRNDIFDFVELVRKETI